ncbi:MAG: YncE family protein [Lentimicrobium sp.]|nr:YncE family protein [Lentimicrobium sp.]
MNKQVASFPRNLFTLTAIMASIYMLSCTKEPEPETEPLGTTSSIATGVYVLNEGLFNANNSSLTRYNFADSTVEKNCFLTANDRGLGDTGSDLAIYGSKMYIVVNVSSQVEVVNVTTCKSLKQIPLFDGNKPRQPRRITFYGSNAFVCNFDGTIAVIDTTSLEVTKFIPVGRNPDGITAAYEKIWVTNSGGLNFPNYDNTISVIDPLTLTEEKIITIGPNPYTILPDGNGDMYVISRGNYGDLKSRLQIVEEATATLKHTFMEFEALNFTIAGDTAWIYNYDYTNQSSSILMLNVKTEEIISNNFITDGTPIKTVYGIKADPISKLVYITDAKDFTGNGKVYALDFMGKLKFEFAAGINPANVAVVNKKIVMVP